MSAPLIPSASRARPPVRRWVLLAVAIAVLLAHVGLLTHAPLALHVHPSSPTADAGADTLRFNTRRMDPTPMAQTPATTSRQPRPASASKRATATSTLTPLEASPAPMSAQDQASPAPTQGTSASPTTEPLVSAPTPADESTAAAPAPAPEASSTPAEPLYNPSQYRYATPPSVRLSYEVQLQVKGFKQNATAEMRWAVEGNSYSARLEVRHWLAGARVQASTGEIAAQGLAPTRFSDKVRSEVAAHFERDKALVTFSANTPSAPLLPGMQDRLSVFMQLASLLAGASSPLPTGTQLLVPVAGSRAADVWRMTLEGSESLTLPGGALNTTKLVRLPQKEYDQKLELWLAPSMGFLPVRIRLTDANGDIADQLWQSSQWP